LIELSLSRCFPEALEEPQLAGIDGRLILWMPLHSQDESFIRPFQGLCRLVLGIDGRNDEPLTNPPRGLMMARIYLPRSHTGNRIEQATRFDEDFVRGPRAVAL
jgi:hypothetical protein